MGTVGDALDNAMCESLSGTMKIEKLNDSRGGPSRTSAPPSSNGSRPGTTAADATRASAQQIKIGELVPSIFRFVQELIEPRLECAANGRSARSRHCVR